MSLIFFKNSKNYLISVFFCILMIFTIGYLIYGLSYMKEMLVKVSRSQQILNEAVLYNSENLYTQLELWEYIYDPNQERLEAFEKHNSLLADDLNILEGDVRSNKDLIYDNGVEDIATIKNDFYEIQQSWQTVLDAVLDYRKVKEGGGSLENIATLKTNLYEIAIKNEIKFDSFEFDEKVNSLVLNQNSYTDSLKTKLANGQWNFSIALLVVAALYIVVFVMIIFWTERIYRKIKILKSKM
jgi:hypothetical protein